MAGLTVGLSDKALSPSPYSSPLTSRSAGRRSRASSGATMRLISAAAARSNVTISSLRVTVYAPGHTIPLPPP
jgi:hypothetical protein